MKKTLASGAELDITLAPFSEAKRLYQAVLKECKGSKIEAKTEIDYNFIKDLILSVGSSELVDEALKPCLARCTYNKARITDELFEGEQARGDYFEIIMEVGKQNLLPFTKGLLSQYAGLLQKITDSQVLKEAKTQE